MEYSLGPDGEDPPGSRGTLSGEHPASAIHSVGKGIDEESRILTKSGSELKCAPAMFEGISGLASSEQDPFSYEDTTASSGND